MSGEDEEQQRVEPSEVVCGQLSKALLEWIGALVLLKVRERSEHKEQQQLEGFGAWQHGGKGSSRRER